MKVVVKEKFKSIRNISVRAFVPGNDIIALIDCTYLD